MADLALAWGAKVSPAFRARVRQIGAHLGRDPSDLMTYMAWESGRSFRADVRNMAGSGAVGLIQFMGPAAERLGTTTDALARLTPEAQLEYVARYFEPYRGRLKTFSDGYMAILWPEAVGEPESFPLFHKDDVNHPARYRQNAGLDVNKDGLVTKTEAAAKVLALRAEGLNPLNAAA